MGSSHRVIKIVHGISTFETSSTHFLALTSCFMIIGVYECVLCDVVKSQTGLGNPLLHFIDAYEF